MICFHHYQLFMHPSTPWYLFAYALALLMMWWYTHMICFHHCKLFTHPSVPPSALQACYECKSTPVTTATNVKFQLMCNIWMDGVIRGYRSCTTTVHYMLMRSPPTNPSRNEQEFPLNSDSAHSATYSAHSASYLAHSQCIPNFCNFFVWLCLSKSLWYPLFQIWQFRLINANLHQTESNFSQWHASMLVDRYAWISIWNYSEKLHSMQVAGN